MRNLSIKAVLFDMDGVITDTMPYHFRAWKKVMKDNGIAVSRCEVFLREGQPGRLTIKEIFAERGRAFDARLAAKIIREKESLFKRIVRPRFVPGARRFIARLAGKGIRMGLVTGTAAHEVAQILPAALRRRFSVRVTGDDVRHGKPHPEPYLLALKKLGLRPRQAVVLENAPFGIHSAKKAGLMCIALQTSLPKAYLKDADLVLSTYRQLERKALFSLSP
ncbi:MAG: HAD family hydrolase [Deltaproteobacteria bacterium]